MSFLKPNNVEHADELWIFDRVIFQYFMYLARKAKEEKGGWVLRNVTHTPPDAYII